MQRIKTEIKVEPTEDKHFIVTRVMTDKLNHEEMLKENYDNQLSRETTTEQLDLLNATLDDPDYVKCIELAESIQSEELDKAKKEQDQLIAKYPPKTRIQLD